MKAFIFAAFFLVAILAEETATHYVTACSGSPSDENSVYGKFIRDLNDNYYEACGTYVYDGSCKNTAEESKCIEYLQNFIWNRCHWRLQYEWDNSIDNVSDYIENSYVEKLLNVAKEKGDYTYYHFIEDCAPINWMWWAITIVGSVLGSYIVLWIVALIMNACRDTCHKSPKVEEKEE